MQDYLKRSIPRKPNDHFGSDAHTTLKRGHFFNIIGDVNTPFH
jgi:hypothetical protein